MRDRSRWSRRLSLPASVMFTRRTATVTISAPAASMARRVSSKSLYFPVPTISRERYALPPISKLSLTALSPSADEMHDLDDVAGSQRPPRVLVARQHFLVQLDRQAAAAQRQLRDQIGDGDP